MPFSQMISMFFCTGLTHQLSIFSICFFSGGEIKSGLWFEKGGTLVGGFATAAVTPTAWASAKSYG